MGSFSYFSVWCFFPYLPNKQQPNAPHNVPSVVLCVAWQGSVAVDDSS